MIQVALSHALSQDRQTTAGKVVLDGSGRVHGRASGSASSWVSTSTRLTTNKPDHLENFTNKPDHQKNLTLKMCRSIMTKRTSTLQSGLRKIEPMTMMR